MQNELAILEDSLAFFVFNKSKHRITVQPINLSPRDLPYWFENLCLYKIT